MLTFSSTVILQIIKKIIILRLISVIVPILSIRTMDCSTLSIDVNRNESLKLLNIAFAITEGPAVRNDPSRRKFSLVVRLAKRCGNLLNVRN